MLYQTIAKIHLDNIRSNIEGIRKAIGQDRKILISVKANGYGHGSVAIGQMAEKIGVDWLGIATIPEGIELRKAGITLPILKFSQVFPEEMEAAINNRITLTVCEKRNIEELEETGKTVGKKVDVHLKVDTGMGRIGVTTQEAPEFAEFIEQSCLHLHLDGIYTHLPVSDDGDPDYTKDQVSRFNSLVDEVNRRIGRKISLAHCSNSAAVLGHPYAWMDMVRPGIMVYGYYPSDETPQSIPLKPGLSLITRVTFVKKVEAGTKIGYSHTWTAPEDTWIATISAGYADGFNRLFSNNGRVLINGKSYPIVGRVCMDQSMVDLGPETNVQVGDEVVLLGKSGDVEISGYEWSQKLNTIPYEITCQINPRVERVYDTYE
jgi:alanine racemase